jgi:hypothetical protein
MSTTANGTYAFCFNGEFSFNYTCSGPDCWGSVFFPDMNCTSNNDATLVSCTNGVHCCGTPVYSSSFTFTEANGQIVRNADISIASETPKLCNGSASTGLSNTTTPYSGNSSYPLPTSSKNGSAPTPTGTFTYTGTSSRSKLGTFQIVIVLLCFVSAFPFLGLAEAVSAEPTTTELIELLTTPKDLSVPYSGTKDLILSKRFVIGGGPILNYLSDVVVTLYVNGFNYWLNVKTGKTTPPVIPLNFWKRIATQAMDAFCQTGVYKLTLEKTAVGTAINACAADIFSVLSPMAAILAPETGGVSIVLVAFAAEMTCNIIATRALDFAASSIKPFLLGLNLNPYGGIENYCNVAHGDWPWPLPKFDKPPPYTPGLVPAKPPSEIFNIGKPIPLSCVSNVF